VQFKANRNVTGMPEAHARTAGSGRTVVGKFVRFVGVGAIATAIQYVILIVLMQVGIASATIASGAGFVLSGIANYFMNYHFTFGSRRAHTEAASRFMLVAVVGLILNTVVMAVGTKMLPVHYLVVQVLATGIVLLWNFLGNHLWSFRDTEQDE
jgi:putative flippase GtrA